MHIAWLVLILPGILGVDPLPPSACPTHTTAKIALSPIIEEGEDSASIVCSTLTHTCRAYAHFIWAAHTPSLLMPATVGAYFNTDGAGWIPALTSATISQTHVASTAGSHTPAVYSTQFDITMPVSASLPKQVCVSPWFHQLITPNHTSCGQIRDYPCANLSSPTWVESASPYFEPSFKFGNWSVVCEDGACLGLGHIAINVNPREVITPVTISASIAWSPLGQFMHSRWEPEWVDAGKGTWLSVFDKVNTSYAQLLTSQRFHVGFYERLPVPLTANRSVACVRISAQDDVTGIQRLVEMEPNGYKDSKFSTRSVYLSAHSARCFYLKTQKRKVKSRRHIKTRLDNLALMRLNNTMRRKWNV